MIERMAELARTAPWAVRVGRLHFGCATRSINPRVATSFPADSAIGFSLV